MYVLDSDSVIRAISLQTGDFASSAAADTPDVSGAGFVNLPRLLTGAGSQLYAGALELLPQAALTGFCTPAGSSRPAPGCDRRPWFITCACPTHVPARLCI